MVRNTGIALLIIAAAAGVWAYYAQEPKKLKPSARTIEISERAKAGPFIVSTKKLSDTEELSIVIIPSRYGEVLDTKCLIYRNTEFKQSSFSCPDGTRYDLADND